MKHLTNTMEVCCTGQNNEIVTGYGFLYLYFMQRATKGNDLLEKR